MEVKKIVFPVGGLGTRFLPATKSMPKEMLPVVDKPIIQYAFEEATNAGIEDCIFITGRNKNAISNHFDHAYELQHVLEDKQKDSLLSQAKDWIPEAGHIAFIRQQKAMGLGHAIYCARKYVGADAFAVSLADELLMQGSEFMAEMIELYKEKQCNIIGVVEIPAEDSEKYGIVDPEGDVSSGQFKISGMVEKPKPADAPSRYAILGRYILKPKIFEYLSTTNAGVGGEIQLTDALNQMAKEDGAYAVVYKGDRFDCGSKIGFLKANLAFALQRDDLKDEASELIQEFASK